MASEEKTVAISGASGLLGRRLTPALQAAGWQARAMVRRQGGTGVYWNPAEGVLDGQEMSGLSAVIHLAGENISGRWTQGKKKRIEESRILGTRLVSETLASLEEPPPVLISASAIGFYGDRGDQELIESHTKGEGFLADVCWRWEAATAAAKEAGIRVVNLRIGVVLAKEGGALAQMLTPFRLGVGGRLGSGKQWFSWIHIEDLVSVILHTLENEDLHGPVNAVAPIAVTNAELTRSLGRVLRRPTLFPVPSLVLDTVFGDMAKETLLASSRVRPKALQEAGFEFRYRDLEAALRAELS